MSFRIAVRLVEVALLIAATCCGSVLLILANTQVFRVVAYGNPRLSSAEFWGMGLSLICSLMVLTAVVASVFRSRWIAAPAAIGGLALSGIWLGMAIACASINTDDMVFRLDREAFVLNAIALIAMIWIALIKWRLAVSRKIFGQTRQTMSPEDVR